MGNIQVPRWVIGGLIVLFLWVTWSAITSKDEIATVTDEITVGDVAWTEDDYVAAQSMVAYERLVQLAVAGDVDGIVEMGTYGLVVPLLKGTSVRVIDSGIGWVEVRVLDGPYDGDSVFISKEFLIK